MTEEQRDELLIAIAKALHALCDKLDDPEHFQTRYALRAALRRAGEDPRR